MLTRQNRVALLAPLMFFFWENSNAALVDDFNDGSTTGWTMRVNSLTEANGHLSGFGLATIDGYSSNSIGVDVTIDPERNPFVASFVALVLHYSSGTDNLFVKLQDNDLNGKYDSVYFYRGFDGDPTTRDTYYEQLSSQVASTYFQLDDNGDGTVTASVGATGDRWTVTLLDPPFTGSGIGVATIHGGWADNFYVLPIPATGWLFGTGLISLVGLGKRTGKQFVMPGRANRGGELAILTP